MRSGKISSICWEKSQQGIKKRQNILKEQHGKANPSFFNFWLSWVFTAE